MEYLLGLFTKPTIEWSMTDGAVFAVLEIVAIVVLAVVHTCIDILRGKV